VSIDVVTTLPVFQGFLSSGGAAGPGSGQIAGGLAAGLFQYLTSAVVLTTVDVGTLGVGTGFGQGLFLEPVSFTASLQGIALSHGLAGSFAPGLCSAISLGLCSALSAASVFTTHPLVGAGAGKVQIIPVGIGPAVFSSAMLAAGLTGPSAPSLGDAVGLALDSSIASVLGAVAISGPPNVYPSSGSGFGRIV
jgi:hypothetical protein